MKIPPKRTVQPARRKARWRAADKGRKPGVVVAEMVARDLLHAPVGMPGIPLNEEE